MINELEPKVRLLTNSSMKKESALSMIERLANAYSTLHLRQKSIDLYWKALLIRKDLRLSTASASVALASELQLMGRYNEALEVVTNEAKNEQPISGIESVLLRQEAQLLDCTGETFAALQKTMRAKTLDKKSGTSGSISDLIQLINKFGILI
jgi:tetratricopeptide (TPR) repeat protein